MNERMETKEFEENAGNARCGTNSSFALAASIAILLFLGIRGITWGAPSEGLASLWFGDPSARRAAYSEAKEYVEGEKWTRSHTMDVVHDTDAVRYRAYFNVIRSFAPDEQDIIKPLAAMKPKQLDFDPKRFIYPSFLTYIVGGAVGAASVVGAAKIVPDLGYYFENPGDFGRMYIIGRIVVLIFACMTLVVVHALAKRMHGPIAAGWSALFLSAIPVWSVAAHFLKVDIPGTFWITSTALFAWLFVENGRLRYLLLSALCSGLAAGTKYNFGLSVVYPLMALGLHSFGKNLMSIETLKRFFLIALVSAAGFFGTNPYILIRFGMFWADFRSASTLISGSDSIALWEAARGPLYFFVHAFPLIMGATMYSLSAIGFVISVAKEFKKTALLASFALLHLMLLANAGIKLAFYMIPLMPLAAIWAGAAIAALGARIGHRAAGAVGAVALIMTFWAAAAEGTLLASDNPRAMAGRWISDNIPAGERIGVLDTPIAFNTPPIDLKKFHPTIIMERDSMPADPPSWFVVSEYRLRYYDMYGDSVTRGAVIKQLDEMGYRRMMVFYSNPTFMGQERPRPRILPEDWLHLAPRITIFHRERSS